MTRTAWSPSADGATVQELIRAAPSTPVAALIAWRAIRARPGTLFMNLLTMRTNLQLTPGGWEAEDESRLAKFEVE